MPFLRAKSIPATCATAQWALLAPLVPAVKPGGRTARQRRCVISNAILYTSCMAATSGAPCGP